MKSGDSPYVGRVPETRQMEEKLPPTLLDPIEIEEIRIPYWRKLFDLIGYPEGLKPTTLRHHAIVEVLAMGKAPPKVVEALETIRELGDPAGQDALMDALADEGIAPQGDEDEGSKEMALRLFVEQQRRPELEQAMLRALASVYERGGRRSLQEFAGKEARPIQMLREKEKLLRDELAKWCAANGMDDYAQVRAFADAEGQVHFLAVHGHRLETPVTVQEGARAVTRLRRAIFDSLRYDPRMGRLKIGARTRALTRMYQSLCGRVFFGDDSFFALEVPCTLKPLQRKGQSALDAHRLPQIAHATIREALWDIGGDRMWVRSKDCFGHMERLGLSRQESELIEAKIELLVEDKRARRVSVTVKVPNRIDFRRDRYEGLVEQYLDEIGVRLPVPEGERRDLWDLYPWEHTDSVWRAAYGPDVDRMREAQILLPVGLRSVRDDEGVPGNLIVVPLGPDARHGVPQSSGARGRALTTTDTSGFRLDILRLAQHMADDGGLEGGVKELSNGVLDLGSLSFGVARLRAFLVARAPGNSEVLAALVQRAAKGTHTVLLVPPGRTTSTGLAQVEVNVMSPPFNLLVREMIHAHRLEDDAPAHLLAKPGDRLIVDSKHGKAWLDGVELQLNPEHHPFKLLHRLAAASPRPVPAETLSKELSPASNGDVQVAKQAKTDLLKKIRASFASVQKDLPSDLLTLILPKSGAYQLQVACFAR